MPWKLRLSLLILLSMLLGACKQPLERIPLENPAFDAHTLQQLRTTEAINIESVLAEKNLLLAGARLMRDPYQPGKVLSVEACQQDINCAYALQRFWMSPPRFPARAEVHEWWVNRSLQADTAAVCGVRFEDEQHSRYSLKTFENRAALEAAPGFYLTHYQACGACSTLQDLAVYGELDLTRMAKTCSKRASFDEKLQCMQAIGFTPACAESWAYNAVKTGQSCALICVAEYGLVPLLTGTESKPPVNEKGELNACLLCDERMAGPGFQYSAGRTRRNSGIVSEIERPDEEVYSVSHDYFGASTP